MLIAEQTRHAAKRNGRNRVICESDLEARAETITPVRVA
jgi:ribosomal protein L36